MEEKDPNTPVVQDFWIDGNYRIAKAKITDDKLDRWVEARYTAFDSVSTGLFPQQVIVTVSGSTPVIMKITYDKITPTNPSPCRLPCRRSTNASEFIVPGSGFRSSGMELKWASRIIPNTT